MPRSSPPPGTTSSGSRPRVACLTASLDEMHQEHWLGVVEEAERLGLDLVTVVGRELDSPSGADAHANAVYDLFDPAVFDGYLLWTTKLELHCGHERFEAFARRFAGRPVVSAEGFLAGAETVAVDEERGSRLAVRHLLEVHGRRRVAYLRGAEHHAGAALRYRGYREALAEAGLEVDPALVSRPLVYTTLRESALAEELARILAAPGPPLDAVAAANDDLATAAASACRAAGLRVPEDVAVVGFDDYTNLFTNVRHHDPDTGRTSSPDLAAGGLALTTARMPFRAVGAEAVRRLAQLLRGEQVAQDLLPCPVVVRHSCGCRTREGRTRDGDLLAALDDVAGNAPSPDAGWAEDLVDGLHAAEHDGGAAFLATCERLLSASVETGETLDPWGEVLAVLRTAATGRASTARAVEVAERMWLHSRRLVDQQATALRDAGQRIAAATSLEQCALALTEHLPHLGVDTFFVALHRPEGAPVEGEPEGRPGPRARLLVACENGARSPVAGPDLDFPTASLLPPSRWESLRGRGSVLLPLNVESRHLGYALLVTGPHVGPLYDALAHQLAGSLHASLLLVEQRRARDELERRVAERTADLARANERLTRANAELREQVAERLRAEDALAHQAMNDPLTDLPNRRLLQELLEVATARLARHGIPVAVLFFDLDGFKWINDHFGHAAGDELLRSVADRLRIALRPEDAVARFGGDEFVVVASDLDAARDVAVIAQRILRTCSDTYSIGGRDVFVNFSVGATVATAGHPSAGQLLSEADSALYLAKRRGRGTVAMFDRSLQEEIDRRVAVETDLHEALRRDELVLHYQPKVRLESGRTEAVEALLRWNHPRRGLLAPGAFLDIAEESDLVVDIGTWVLREACRQARAWARVSPEPPVVQVNLAARQIADPRLLDHVDASLADSGLSPDLLGVEITESRLLTDLDQARSVLDRLGRKGIKVALDDFGTGYSSLTWLQQLPVHEVKLDRSFVAHIVEDEHDQRIVRSVIELAHVLDLVVIGEGIENAAQEELLRSAGCEYGQGYHLGRPVPPDALRDRFGRGDRPPA